jgi:hypothetical protein
MFNNYFSKIQIYKFKQTAQALIACNLFFLINANSAEDLQQMGAGHPDKKIYELRTYTTFAGKLDALERRFKDHTMALFAKHGIKNITYWKPLQQPNTLIYIVAHPSLAEAAVAWNDFANDPDWQAVYSASISEGRLVENIEKVFMTKTAYSPLP